MRAIVAGVTVFVWLSVINFAVELHWFFLLAAVYGTLTAVWFLPKLMLSLKMLR